MAGTLIEQEDAGLVSRRWAQVVLALLVVAGLGLRLAIAWQDVPTLLEKTLPDDAFYYFGIARNIVDGNGPTFDGIHPTNGYHPLWLAFLLPVYALAGGDTLPIHLALTLSALFGAATVVVLYLAARELTGRLDLALLAAGFFALHPPVILQSMNGLESALALLLFSGALLIYVRIQRRSVSGPRAWLSLGVALGLLSLARTDLALFAVAAVVALALVVPQRERLRAPATATAALALVVAPWLLWNLVTFGTVVQDSGQSVPYVVRENYRHAHEGLGSDLRHSYELTRDAATQSIPLTFLVPDNAFRLPFLIGFPVGAALLALVSTRSQRRRLWRGMSPLLPAAIAVAGLVFVHAAVRWYLRPWYFMAVVPLLALLLAALLAPYLERAGRRRALALLAPITMLLVAGFLYRGVGEWDRGLYFCATDLLDGSAWLERHLDGDERAGSFNAGILGYFSDGSVVNLDGAVNNSVFGALRDRELLAYVQEENITYLAENAYFLDGAFGLYWDGSGSPITSTLEPVAAFNSCDDYPWGATYVYRVPAQASGP